MRRGQRSGRGNEEGGDAAAHQVSTIREKGFLTRILVLSHLRSNPRATLREMGDRLGITMQAVSLYVLGLEREGLVEDHPLGGRRLSPYGLQWLQDGLVATKHVIDAALEPITVIKATSAIAGERIDRGVRVGLTMERGFLVARPGEDSPSQGRALNDAKGGEELLVTELEGIVELQPGRILVTRLPRPEEGGSTRVDKTKLRDDLEAQSPPEAKLGILGLGARIVAAALGNAPDFEFGAAHAAFHAAELGINSVLLVTGDQFRECMTALEQLNAQSPQHVVIDVIQAPVIPQSPPTAGQPARERRSRVRR